MALTKVSSEVIQTGAITTEKIAGSVSLGVKVSNVFVSNSNYYQLDDTAVATSGGYVIVSGSGFQSGAEVIVGEEPATSTTFISSTELRAQLPAKTAATYTLYVVNPDGGTATRVRGITYSGLPTWVTSSTLTSVQNVTSFTGSFDATGATSYANTTALPTGFNLVSANGYYYGNIEVANETTYSFTIRATDDENQDSDRTFSLTATVPSGEIAISPSVGGLSTIDLSTTDLNLESAGTWTITPTADISVNVKMWGAGGTNGSTYAGGAGGYSHGDLTLTGGQSYVLRVGSPSGGGASGGSGAGAGGGYSGIFSSSIAFGNSIIIAGGGAGGVARYTITQYPGAGGGTTGQSGSSTSGSAYPGEYTNGGGGTQSAGGAGKSSDGGYNGQPGGQLTGGAGGTGDSYFGSGGGSGYYGGGGGGSRVGGDGGNNSTGGGGSGYVGSPLVSNGVTVTGSNTTAGNSSDPNRNNAGNSQTAGKILLSLIV